MLSILTPLQIFLKERKETIYESSQEKKAQHKKTLNSEFWLKIVNCIGVFKRTKLITISPRYYIKNESSSRIIILQDVKQEPQVEMQIIEMGQTLNFQWRNDLKSKSIRMAYLPEGK